MTSYCLFVHVQFLQDLKIFINDVDVATSASLSRSTDVHGRVVTNMTDGNDSTMYHSDFVSDENWVLIELDSTYSLNDLHDQAKNLLKKETFIHTLSGEM